LKKAKKLNSVTHDNIAFLKILCTLYNISNLSVDIILSEVMKPTIEDEEPII